MRTHSHSITCFFIYEQCVFRNQHSTELAALELVDIIVTKKDLIEVPTDIYLDSSKAFDALDHEILTYQLYFYGMHDKSS